MFAIINTKNNKWLYGTDYRYNPPRQKTDNEKAITFLSLESAKASFKNRRCGSSYKIVKVELNAKN